jgi:hypothetical protein
VRSSPSLALLFAALWVPHTPLLAQNVPLPAGTVPSQENSRIHDIVASVSAERIERDIRTLVGFGTRHTLSDTLSDTRGIGAARRWIFEEFNRISEACGGCLEVSYQSGVVRAGSLRLPTDTRIVNVVAVLRGRLDPNRYVIHTGDIDDRVSDLGDFTSDNPGANDNASGMAAVLENARVLSGYPADLSIAFVGLSGEEQGLLGGEILAEHALAEGWEIEAIINNDMVGNIEGITGVIDNTTARVFAPGLHPATSPEELNRILRTGGEIDTPARQLARYIDRAADMYVPNLDVEIIYRLDRFGRGGHHTPFFMAGFPASVRLMEAHEDYVRQHQTLRVEDGVSYGDVLEGVNFEYAAKVTALDAASIAALAWAPASPDWVIIQGAVQASPTLRWSAVPAVDLLGYRVYWRKPTDPGWTFSRFVGNVTEYAAENVVIDNWFFGVAAVDREGNESLVVFPGG